MTEKKEQHYCEQVAVIAELRTNMKAAFLRIDEQRAQGEALIKLTDSMHVLASTVAVMAEKIETITKSVEKVETSVAKLEDMPVEDFRRYKTQWIGGAVMLLIGYIMGAFLKGLVL